jgi:hypothetical protein
MKGVEMYLQSTKDNLKKQMSILKMTEKNKGDIRGFEVFDINGVKVGIIDEVYYCADNLYAQYIEIFPNSKYRNINYIYPYDLIDWNGRGPVHIPTSLEALDTYSDYDAEMVLWEEMPDLICFDEVRVIEEQNNLWDEEGRYCA